VSVTSFKILSSPLTRTNKTRSWGNGDQATDSARTEANSRPLALQAVIPEHPGDSTDRSSEVSDDTGLRCTEIRRQSTTTVESEPAEPKEDGSENNVGGVVGLVGEFLRSITGTLSEVDGDGEGGGARRNVNGSSTSEIETTLDVRPSVGVPCHAGKRTVDNRRPDENEYKGGAHATAFGDGTNGKDRAKMATIQTADLVGNLETYVMAANMHW